jgi:heat shock protein HslJ
MSERLKFRLLILALSVLALSACGPREGGEDRQTAAAEPTSAAPVAEPAKPAPAAQAAPSWQEAANAEYAGVFDEAVVLRDGIWEGEPYAEGGASAPRAGLAEDFLLSGDLDGDAAEESVVLLWSSSGGSGTFDYLAVLDRDATGAAVNRATAPLGDRVKVRSAALEDGRVAVETVQAGPQDAACCPGQKMRRTFTLEGDTMTETSTEDLGRMSLADLAGEWKLVRFGADEAVPDDVEITAQFAEGVISGRAACNRYTGSVTAGDMPGDLSLAGPMAMTRMMCQPPLMEWEQRYAQALEGLAQYSFVAGQLVLSWRDESSGGSLFFVRVAEAPVAAE